MIPRNADLAVSRPGQRGEVASGVIERIRRAGHWTRHEPFPGTLNGRIPPRVCNLFARTNGVMIGGFDARSDRCVLVAAILLTVPGTIFGAALGLRGWLLLGSGPVLTLGVAAVITVLTSALGIAWTRGPLSALPCCCARSVPSSAGHGGEGPRTPPTAGPAGITWLSAVQCC